jgi:L-ascorbate metabolism protein UlaG (beta-lactamase superfamily)
MPAVEPDIVTVSHEHSDHNTVSAVGGKPQVLRGDGEWTIKDLKIRSTGTFHDDSGGAQRGTNTVFVFETAGLRICHLGDLGHVLTAEQKTRLGSVDILLIPVGGNYTIDAVAAQKVCEQLNPRVIVPMHYKTEAVARLAVAPVDEFMKNLAGRRVGANFADFTAESIKTFSRAVLVLEYK